MLDYWDARLPPCKVKRTGLTFHAFFRPLGEGVFFFSASACCNQDCTLALLRSPTFGETEMQAFIRRFLMYYGIYRRYPLGRLPALRNAWRITRDVSAAPLRSARHDTPLGMAISLYTDDTNVV